MKANGEESSSLLDEVRARCREVAEQSSLVEIDNSALSAYAASLPTERLLLPEMDPAIHYLGHGADTVAFYLTLDAVNFGSGYFPDIFGYRQSGYRTIAAALNDHFASAGPIPAQRLSSLSRDECAGIFGLDLCNPAACELVACYTTSLSDLGAFLCKGFGCDFGKVVEMAGGSAERLVSILVEMPLFRDVSHYDSIAVPFYKRAQLTAVDLFIAFCGKGPGRFADIDRLTICTDNLVPHVLRLDGVLRYRQDLAERVDKGAEIPAGSPEEVEIRACAVHACEQIVEELKGMGKKVNAMLLDNLLWHRGQQPSYRARPRHRTRTVFY